MGDAKWPRRDLWHTYFAQLIKQRPVAYLKPLRRLLPVPAVFLEHLQDDLPFEILRRLLGNVLQRDRLAEVDLGDDAAGRLRHKLRDERLLAADKHVAADKILKLPDVTRPMVVLH